MSGADQPSVADPDARLLEAVVRRVLAEFVPPPAAVARRMLGVADVQRRFGRSARWARELMRSIPTCEMQGGAMYVTPEALTEAGRAAMARPRRGRRP